MPTSLSATPITSPQALSATSLANSAGTYPGADTYPASDDYPGRGSDLQATAIVPGTDFIPVTVPFEVKNGSRPLTAVPIT